MRFGDNLKSLTIETNVAATTTEPSYSVDYTDTEANRVLHADGVGALTNTTPVTVVPAMNVGTLERAITNVTVFNRDTTAKTVTVKKLSSTTGYIVAKAVLGASESMVYDGSTWTVYSAAGEAKVTTLGSATSTAGVKNGATVSAVESGTSILHQTVLTCTATPITISDEAGQGQYGGVKVYDFPEGMICTLGAMVSGTVLAGVTGTIINNWDGDVGLGTAAVADHQDVAGLTGSVLQKSDVSAGAADKIGVVAGKTIAAVLTESGARWIDGTATPVDLYLNFLIDDDVTHTAGSATFTGTITITWMSLGDV